MDKELLTVEEVSGILGVHPITIRRYIKDNKIKASKIGGQWRITSSDLKEFMCLDNFNDKIAKSSASDLQQFVQGKTHNDKVLESCVILNYHVDSAEKATPLCEKIISKVNSEHSNQSGINFQYFYMEEEKNARIIVYGNPKFLGKILCDLEEFDS